MVLSLKIQIKQSGVTKTLNFDPACLVYDACRSIREKVPDAKQGQAPEFGLFLADKDVKKGMWLESGRSLEYYLLRNGDFLEYRSKLRPLKVRTLDGSVKTIRIDDSQTVETLMVTICTKLGILNHEEYSLARELQEEEDAGRKDTGTLLRPGTTDKRFETLKKKLHTDDELNWVNHAQTLREQGVEDFETVILRRKYFYSDQNVDSRDPIQLNLLYVQSRDGILKGQYPVNEKDAITFAGLQLHIQLGPHDEKKHKPGYIDLKEYLPKEYVKNRGIDKKMFAEHKQLTGVNELDAKARYTRNCRDLKTYGVAFFLVKEKMKGKNKLVPRLMGITRESVMRLDERTKDIMKVWPLTSVKRWAASPKSFTLDFGDYQDGYYSVQTTEGEQIAQIIAGYIDIILKKRSKEGVFQSDGDEDSAMMEEEIGAKRAHMMSQIASTHGTASTHQIALPGVLRTGGSGQPGSYMMGSVQQASQVNVRTNFMYGGTPMNSTQQALMGNIETALNACRAAQAGFSARTSSPNLGTDAASKQWRMNAMEDNRHNIEANLSSIHGAVANMLQKTSEGEIDFSALGSAVATITASLSDLTNGLKFMSSLIDENNADDLIKAAGDLTSSITDLLRLVQPSNEFQRKQALDAAARIGDASRLILDCIGSENDERFQEMLTGLAKQVALATSSMLMEVKSVSDSCHDPSAKQKVASGAGGCATATSELVNRTKLLGPTIADHSCQEQLINSATAVSRAVDGCVDIVNTTSQDPNLLKALGLAAGGVENALDDLIKHIKQGSTVGKYDDLCEKILEATDKLCNSMGDAAVMVKQARLLAETASSLAGLLKMESESADNEDMRNRLLGAARILAEATGKMVEAARAAAKNPNDSQHQENLKSAAENLLAATNAATQNALRKKLVQKLENAARHAAVSATQAAVAANATETHNSNKTSAHQLATQAKTLQQDHVPRLLRAIRQSHNQPNVATSQLNLVSASSDFMAPGLKMISQAKAAVPTIGDQASAAQLAGATRKLALALSNLKSAASKAGEVCAPSGIESALDTVRGLNEDITAYSNDARDNMLLPLPGQTMRSCAQELGATSKVIGAAMAQLLTAATQGNADYTGMAARDTANALRTFVEASRGVAAHLPDLDSKLHLLECVRGVVQNSGVLLQESEIALNDPNNPEIRQKLAKGAKAVSQSLAECIGHLPGQRDVDLALKRVAESSNRLLADQLPSPTSSFQVVQSQLNRSAENLNIAANDVVGSCRGDPSELALSSNKYTGRFDELLDAGINMAAQWKDKEDQRHVVDNLKSVSMSSSKLLLAAKALSADPAAPNVKNQLAAAARIPPKSPPAIKIVPPRRYGIRKKSPIKRAVTESINNLITHCTQSSPGQKECDNALRQIDTIRDTLENPNEPVSDFSYFDCLESAAENSKLLGESAAGISQHARNGELEAFSTSVTNTQAAVIALTEAAAQAAYLVGIADPNSEAGSHGLVDQSQFARANQAVQMACQTLIDPSSSQEQVLSATALVAKHTTALCNVCRVASNKTNNAVARKHFIQAAKDVAQATGLLVKSVKAVDGNFTGSSRAMCSQAADSLVDAVDNLTTFVSNPEFASVPAKISAEAREAQRPIIESGQRMLESSTELLQNARKLASNPKDPPTWQVMTGVSRVLADAIKNLISTIRDNAPGQIECDQAIDQINRSIQQLNDASLYAMDQALPPRSDNTLQGFQTQVVDTVNQISTCIQPTANAAREDASLLGRQVAQLASYFEPLANATVGAASNSANHQRQIDILDYSKTLAESVLQLMYAAKESGGNPKAVNTHREINEAEITIKEAVDDLLKSAQEAPEAIMSGLVDSISKAAQSLDHPVRPEGSEGFAAYQTRIVGRCRAILVNSSGMTMSMNTRPEELGGLAKKVAQEYGALASDGAYAIALADSNEVSNHIKKSIADLGGACKELLAASGQVQSNPRDIHAKKALNEAGRNVKEKVSFVMSSLQQGGRGTQACIDARTKVQGIIGDLDTTLMFISSGALEKGGGNFADHKEAILKAAKMLVEDAKSLAGSVNKGQEAVASAVQSSSTSIADLADAIKLGAISLGADDEDTQALLINAVRDVASTLSDLINATKDAAAKNSSDAATFHLKTAAKSMVTSVTALLNTVKSVEDKAAKGSRALEQTINSIKQELKSLHAIDGNTRRATPEELIQATKPITSATAKAVAAGNSCRQEDMIACANVGRKAVFDLIHISKGCAAQAEDQSQAETILNFTKSCSEAYAALLSNVLASSQQPGNVDLKLKLPLLSKSVATAVSNLVRAGEGMKGSDWVDPNDPNVIAEQELLAAAASIEAAAKKLALLRPRKKVKEVDDSLNFEEQILEAAKSIAAATTALVKAASAAQKELVMQGKVGAVPSMRHDDGQWSQGLISAAQLVARSTGNLCEAANQAVQGEASEEKLVTSAKQVASSTAQLLVACKVKADPNSENMKRLQSAGNAVKKAADTLVQSAKDVAFQQEAEVDAGVSTSGGLVGSIRDEMEAMEKILSKEKELKEAMEKLKRIREKKYHDPAPTPPPKANKPVTLNKPAPVTSTKPAPLTPKKTAPLNPAKPVPPPNKPTPTSSKPAPLGEKPTPPKKSQVKKWPPVQTK